jgi:putative DNA primase/helicase
MARAIASARTVAAVEKLARADRRLAATVEQWDCDSWLLNTPGGTLDLRTGETREHNPEDYCTKLTGVAAGGQCPRWLAFLNQVTGGDCELARFLARMAGYALTGLVRDHAVFFLYGSGGNGKGVFVGAISKIMGDYAMSSPIETFMAATYDRHPTEIARLRGARLVTASEPEKGRPWNDSKLKLMTGGDKITGRFMGKDFFDYWPQFELLISGNYKPSFKGVNEAIRRRLHLVPFTVTIPAGERDTDLLGKLCADEGPGILAWAIGGCLEWGRSGLAPPAAVRDATASYLDAEDTFGDWLDACCTRVRGQWTATRTLHANWSAFTRQAGEESGSVKAFSEQMQERGFVPKRLNSGRGFSDVMLRK